MRTLQKNKQDMYYSLQGESVPIYEEGEYTVSADGSKIPVETGEEKVTFSKPVPFSANIAMSGGESKIVEYGLDKTDYEAILVVDKGILPLKENDRIWYESEPLMNDDGTVDEFSADYIVVKKAPSLNGDRFILKKVVK